MTAETVASSQPPFAADALAGQRALVTGGTRGIGHAVAIALARAGADVVVTYARAEADAAAARADLVALGARDPVRQCDVRDRDAVAGLFAELKTAGGVDILVNNAAITRDAHLMLLSDDAWNDVLATNLTGPFLCIRPALRAMIAQALRAHRQRDLAGGPRRQGGRRALRGVERRPLELDEITRARSRALRHHGERASARASSTPRCSRRFPRTCATR